MGNQKKVDQIRLAEMLRSGMTPTECAKEFGVTHGAISQLKKKMTAAADNYAGAVTTELCGDNIDSMAQLKNINNTIISELRRCNRLITHEDIKLQKKEDLEQQLKENPGDPAIISSLKELCAGSVKDILNIQSNIISISAEVRKQVELQIKIAETLYNIQYTQEFQNEVLEAIKAVDADVRDKIVAKLKERRVVRGLIGMGK